MNEILEKENLVSKDLQCAALKALTSVSHTTLSVFVDQPPLHLFDDEGFIAALRDFLLRHAQRQLRLCLQHEGSLPNQIPRLLELAGRLPSRIGCRLAAAEHRELTQHYVLADHQYCMRRVNPSAREWQLHRGNTELARLMADNFETVWQHAEPHPEFRRLSL